MPACADHSLPEATPPGAAYRRFPLGRGLSVHVLSSRKWKTVFVDVFIRRELDGGTSALGLLPSILKRGTTKLPDLRAMTRRVEELYGASVRSDILKIGELQVLLVRLEIVGPRYVPSAPSILDDGLDLLRDLIFDPRLEGGVFPAAVVEQEKKNQVRYIDGLQNDKGAYASERCCEEMCRGEPFGLYEYGSTAGVRALDGERLTAFWRELLDRAPIDVFVAGDLDPLVAADHVARRFDRPRRGDLAPRLATPHPPPGPPREVLEDRPIKQGKLVLGLRSGITARDPDFHALLFLNGVLGSYPHSKLFRAAREREGLCYYASSSIEKTKGVMLIAAGIDAASYGRARELIDAELGALAEGRVTDEEMELTRKALRRNYETIADSPARTATHAYTAMLNEQPEAVERSIAAIERVSRDDLVRAARALRLDTVYFLRSPATGQDAPAKEVA